MEVIRLPHLAVGEPMPHSSDLWLRKPRSPAKIEAPKALTSELTDADIAEIVRHDTEDVR